MTYTARGSDYDLFRDLLVTADRSTAPGWTYGKYVHPTKPRAVLRQSDEDRHVLLDRIYKDGLSHEKTSDIAPFVFWDGEGITYEQGHPQSYVLFGSSLGHEVRAHELHTVDCLDLIIQAERDYPRAIHVAFSFKYDAEMILADMPLRSWYQMIRHGTVWYQGFRITYHPGRMFRVSKRIDKQMYTATVYDVFGFFQQSFVKALRGWLDDEELLEIDRIEQGKDARGAFTYDQLDDFIAPYWRAELRLGVLLMDRLRDRLRQADVCPSQWYGAGSIATTLYRRSRMRAHLARTTRDRHDSDSDVPTALPEAVNDAASHAYFGGRFELMKLGHTDRTVYQYDIRSAYPNAIAMLPSLADSEWQLVYEPTFDSSLFAMWWVEYDRWDTRSLFHAGPLPCRDKAGRVSYPTYTRGWYWSPEAALIANDPHAHITKAWVCHHVGEYPFLWVRDLYDERQRRKAARDPSEKAYKLALNSLYGKMAQRLGYDEDKGQLPRFHQLEWAGWVTSYTRMMLYTAMRQAGPDLIATETDAVFTFRKLPKLTVGTALGEWDMTVHTWMTYLQSGTYWSDHGAKYRGFDANSLSHDEALRWLRRGDWNAPLVGSTTRFVGAGRGLGTPFHRCWVTEARDLQPGATGKRKHVPDICPACIDGASAATDLHPLMTSTRGGRSQPHHLPWINDEVTPWDMMDNVDRWDADAD